MRTLLNLCLVWTLLLSSAAVAEDQISAPAESSLRALIDEALVANADLRAAESRAQMFSRKVAPASSLNDPRLSFGLLNYPADSLASDEIPMTGNDVRLEQAFPFPGKLGLKGQIARQQAAWYQAVYLDMRTEVVRQVRDRWYRLYSLEHALELVRGNLEAIEQLIRLSETRYAVGKGLQQDVLKAQLQRSRLMDREFALVQERAGVVAAMLALLNRDSADEIDAPESLSEELALPELDAVLVELEQNRPLFEAYQALIRQYQAQKGLAEKEFYPDFGMWAGYRFRDDDLPDGGEDFLSAGVSINLPIYRTKRHAKVADAEAGVAMARQQYRQLRNQTVSALKESMARLEQTRDQVLLFKSGIIPQAQQTFDAGLRAYQVGKISFKDLVDSLMALYNYQIDYHRALGEFHRSQARFDQLAGRDSHASGEQKANRD